MELGDLDESQNSAFFASLDPLRFGASRLEGTEVADCSSLLPIFFFHHKQAFGGKGSTWFGPSVNTNRSMKAVQKSS